MVLISLSTCGRTILTVNLRTFLMNKHYKICIEMLVIDCYNLLDRGDGMELNYCSYKKREGEHQLALG